MSAKLLLRIRLLLFAQLFLLSIASAQTRTITGTVTSKVNADQFATVNGPDPGNTASVYGYKLLANYADLWKVSNKFNPESVIEFVHSALSNGGWSDAGASEGNLLCITTGPRGYSQLKATAPDYFSGYSFLVFTKSFFDFIHYDPRCAATVANLDSLKTAGAASYTAGYNNTGYFLGKFIGRVSNKAATTPELNFGQDEYEIRLADTYLMEAEALMNTGANVGAGSRAYQLFNAVRARVGLAPADIATKISPCSCLAKKFKCFKIGLGGGNHC